MFRFWFKPVSLLLLPKTLNLSTKELPPTGALCSWETHLMRISDMSKLKGKTSHKDKIFCKIHPHCKAKLYPRVPINPWAGRERGPQDAFVSLSYLLAFCHSPVNFPVPLTQGCTHGCSHTYTHLSKEEKKSTAEQLPNNSFHSLCSPGILLLILCPPTFC